MLGRNNDFKTVAAVVGAAFVATAFLRAQPAPFQIEETTIARVHAAMKAHQLTCHQLVDAYLQRIAKYDKNSPPINSIVLTNPDALKEADELDKQFAAHGLTGPLHCVPTIVKDNYETIGLQSADGSLALKGFVSDKDAFLVKRMKAAGAIVLAKSNMAEFAFSPNETVNSLLGTTRNPYDLTKVPAGSSGGTAAAIASNFGLVGLGSDTGNSIRGPSSHNALVGIRSTMGLTSRAGIAPLSYLADIGGPMARTVEDATAVFQVIVGEDPEDPMTARSHGRMIPKYADALKKDGLKGARIGVLHQAWERQPNPNAPPNPNPPPVIDDEVAKVFAQALADMKAAGATIVDDVKVDLPTGDRGNGCRGFKYDLDEYLATRGKNAPVHSLAEILASPAFASFPPSVAQRARQAANGTPQGPDSDACKANAAYRQAFGEAVTKAMDGAKLTVYVYPTWSFPPRPIESATTQAGDNSQVFSPTSGFPAMNVPMGFTRDNTLPAGMTIFGRAWDEATLIRIAYAYEQATHRRHPPTLH
jgi:Asp-tRNA(Asn)/Glu-tRNA(Gln) amidotransferase A subunit family amidase